MSQIMDSPFFPGNPVSTELFVGRTELIDDLLSYIKQTKSGRHENIFIIGERGIGKSSLASFVRHVANAQHNLIGIHVFLGGITSLEDMVRHILQKLIKEAGNQPWFDKIKHMFGQYVKQLDLFGISIEFSPPLEQTRALVANFPEVLYNIVQKLQNEKSGLLIILDDINGLAENRDFANWYKTFVDTVTTQYTFFPVTLILSGLPERRDSLAALQPSLMRIFRPIEIHKLSDDEVKAFFGKAFAKVNTTVNPEALDVMVRYSSGLPILMQEIGDATFWVNKDNTIDGQDASRGILKAADIVGMKYLDAQIYRAIRSKPYRTILKKLCGESPITHFVKNEIESTLTENEKKVFHNFLDKFKKLGIIESDVEQGRGAYRFVNRIYPVYLYLESASHHGK